MSEQLAVTAHMANADGSPVTRRVVWQAVDAILPAGNTRGGHLVVGRLHAGRSSFGDDFVSYSPSRPSPSDNTTESPNGCRSEYAISATTSRAV